MPVESDKGRRTSRRRRVLEELRDRVRERDIAGIRALLSGTLPADVAELLDLGGLGAEADSMILGMLDTDVSSEVLREFGPESMRALAEEDPGLLAQAVEEMEPDEVADVLEVLSEEASRAVLDSLPQREATIAEQLLAYGHDTAGGIMTPDFVLLPAHLTAAEAIKTTQRSGAEETAGHLFVKDEEGRLAGEIPLHRLVFAPPQKELHELMKADVVAVNATAGQEEAVRLATKYNLEVVPVVDDEQRLVGVITADDILEAAEEEGSEDLFRLSGTAARDPLRQPVLLRALLRLPWLIITLATGFLSGQVMRWLGYEPGGTTALLLFVPVMTGMAGNVSLQSSTIIVRGLATGDLHIYRFFTFVAREIAGGLIVGLTCGVLAGLVAFAFFGGQLGFAIVVACSLLCGVITAVITGTGIPLLCDRMGVDPALASGPFVTSLNDITGIVIYLGLGASLLKYLPS